MIQTKIGVGGMGLYERVALITRQKELMTPSQLVFRLNSRKLVNSENF